SDHHVIDDLAKLTPDLGALGWDEEIEEWANNELSLLEEFTDPTSEGSAVQESAGQEPDGDEPPASRTVTRGRIARVSRGFSLVFTGGDAVLAASGSMRTRTGLVPATGDYVIVVDDPEDGPSLAAIAPR
ncbi:MAG: hypothetical protein ACRBK7_05550, partial [Acidimicrobiales bacterium]